VLGFVGFCLRHRLFSLVRACSDSSASAFVTGCSIRRLRRLHEGGDWRLPLDPPRLENQNQNQNQNQDQDQDQDENENEADRSSLLR